ncbi:MAG: GNAT family N-acetyltransferase [Gammaproteobacteria bacterium]|nr:GNAT family N-acetyltransferase [Gammaproteobacteria bacterium]
MSLVLDTVLSDDVDEVMGWFTDAAAVDIWGGPAFRFPFTRETFHEDCRWQDFATFCLRDTDRLLAFGQLGERYRRAHLARLIANPAVRGRGVGKQLIMLMLDEARRSLEHPECGLFVYKHNKPAYHCYLSVGFEVQDYPEDAPMPEKCLYLTRTLG